jgi:hypothetical protein
MPIEKLKHLLNFSNHGDLGDIVKRARKMGELTDIVARALPETDRASVIAANIRGDGELIVICASPAWASRLRFETDAMLKAAQNAGEKVHTCRVRVSQG